MSTEKSKAEKPGVGLRPLVMRPVKSGERDHDAIGRQRLAGMLEELEVIQCLMGPNATNDLFTRFIWIEQAIQAAIKQATQDA